MTAKIWRYSHFALTVSSSLFLLIATLSGAFLAFEPIQNKLRPFKVNESEELPIAQILDTLTKRFDEVLELEVDSYGFVKVSVISHDPNLDGDYYINPFNGDKIGTIPEKGVFFEFVTNLHRSLFLKTIGRIFVGITSFLLCLIAITGLLLAIKRLGGITKIHHKIIKDDFAQYYHLIFGRLSLVPILVIAITGCYLSLVRFDIISEGEATISVNNSKPIAHDSLLPLSQFKIFKETKLKDLRSIEFPFSTDEDDYFILRLQKKELRINQKNGEVVEVSNYPSLMLFQELSFNLHTGTGSILWSLVLAVACLSILFFMYSGALISYKRLRSRQKNKYSAHEAEFVILIGSENGNTKRFGGVLQKALLHLGKKVYVDQLNAYKAYAQIKHLVILTSTYGEGAPPSNASKFIERLKNTPITNTFQCAVVGFGSLAYEQFCQFAQDAHVELIEHQQITIGPNDIFLIHNQSYIQFKTWANQWGKQIGLDLKLPIELSQKKPKTISFKVLKKECISDAFDETFILTLKAEKTAKFTSGDLLSIIPPNDILERLYSIGTFKKDQLILSIKKHDQGVCSNYLKTLLAGDILNATIQKNKSFHFPKNASSVTLIANGTGIAPFLGMIHQKTSAKLQLYWGGRTFKSIALYETYIKAAQSKGTLNDFYTAFSKEEFPFNYVQDLIERDQKKIAGQLKSGGYIMLCGSIAMQNDVLLLLEKICTIYGLKELSEFKKNNRILMDCY